MDGSERGRILVEAGRRKGGRDEKGLRGRVAMMAMVMMMMIMMMMMVILDRMKERQY